jgi:hypothetical protein
MDGTWRRFALGLGLMTMIGGMVGGLFGCSAHAGARLQPQGGGVSLTLVDASGVELPRWVHKGVTWVAGAEGERYGLRLRNETGERLEVVVTVDGRDVLTGDVGDFARQRGYVLAPWQTSTIDGFRTSMQTVAAFRFTSPDDSYSARMGTPQHVGVIGVAVFRERQVVSRTPSLATQPARRAEAPAPATPGTVDLHGSLDGSVGGGARDAATKRSSAATSDESFGAESAIRNRIGTQYGESRHSAVVESRFERAHATRPSRILGLYYDSVEGLRARGVPVDPVVTGGPDPFPGRRFAPPPP